MWTQDDDAVQAFAALLEGSHEHLVAFLEAVWTGAVRDLGEVPKTPGYAIIFTLGKFSQSFKDRRELHAGEDVRDSLHMTMNHILNEPTTQALIGQLTGAAFNSAVGAND